MHLYPVKRGPAVRRFLPLALIAALIVLLSGGLGLISRTSEQEQLAAAERAIQKALVSCYAIEGEYPASLRHLEEHYGLVIDRDRFVVEYERIGSNIRPTVLVVRRGGAIGEGRGPAV